MAATPVRILVIDDDAGQAHGREWLRLIADGVVGARTLAALNARL